MLKRLMDVFCAVAGLLLLAPVIGVAMLLVWRQDGHSPLYIAPRVGQDEQLFRLIKLRSMIINADKSGVDSTSVSDRRITPLGQFIRRFKLDEITQLWNVLIGDMSLVGPRPNVKRDTDIYTPAEKHLLSVKPGITDFSSIVFADEGDILKDQSDPDIAYNQLIRPWKSRLGLFYVEHRSLLLDIRLVWLTLFAIAARQQALRTVSDLLATMGADSELVRIARRQEALVPTPPPGLNQVVTARN